MFGRLSGWTFHTAAESTPRISPAVCSGRRNGWRRGRTARMTHAFWWMAAQTGNLAMLLATCNPGDEVIISRMLHKSLLAGLVFSGARPVYLKPALVREHNLPLDTTPDAVESALARHPSARAVVLVSPSYVGVTSDLQSISRFCRQAGVPLLVDEAWGPHLHFHPGLPPSAMQAGADASVSSTHKMLGALTQGSTLVMRRGLLDIERLHTVVDMVQTTSPSVLIWISSTPTGGRWRWKESASSLERSNLPGGCASPSPRSTTSMRSGRRAARPSNRSGF